MTDPSRTYSISAYLRSAKAIWYWLTITSAVIAIFAVSIIPENFYPWIYFRNILGVFFILCLPGYALSKALFPLNILTRPSTENLDKVMRVTLSIVLSLVIVPMVIMLLNYSPWGIRLAPVVLSLFVLTVFFATVALIREYSLKEKIEQDNLEAS